MFANDVAYVTTSTGTVEAVSESAGAKKWSGSNIDAVSESTGKLLWSHATGGSVADTPALTTFATGGIPLLLVGSNDGTLYAINGSNGTVQWSVAYGQPIVGVATCDSVVAATTASGDVFISRTYTNLLIWHTTTNATAGISAAPAIVDGAVYVGGGDGHFYAFTGFGQPPS